MVHIYKSFAHVQVLCDVNFELLPGEVHILAGENGAGKSTLIKILSGVHTDYTGQVYLEERPVQCMSVMDAASEGISVIHQELSLVGPMSVAENIFLGREQSKGSLLFKRAMIRKAQTLLGDMGLDVDVTRAVEDYPISVQQMIEICKALTFDSRIMIMDEPTSALTGPEVENLFTIIEKLKARGCGIIYISHKMEEIYRIADRITVLRDGQYIGTDTAARLDRDQLVHWMVGRELGQQFPRHLSRLGSTLLEIKYFSVPDPAFKATSVVRNVSFSVKAGEILGLAGLQGSGNSELLHAIFGAYGNCVEGEINIDGFRYKPDSPGKAIKHAIALLTNDRKENGLVLEMGIQENITLASLPKFSPGGWLQTYKQKQAALQQAQDLKLKYAGLDQWVQNLSGGNQQKVVLAKWIETEPKLLLLDEPTRGVDVAAKHEIYELMNQWTAQGISIILITSEMPELLTMSDRIIVMHGGRITAEFDHEQASQDKILSAAMGQIFMDR